MLSIVALTTLKSKYFFDTEPKVNTESVVGRNEPLNDELILTLSDELSPSPKKMLPANTMLPPMVASPVVSILDA